MKLGKCAAALVVTSFLLTGCGNSKTVKEDGKYVVASLSKNKRIKIFLLMISLKISLIQIVGRVFILKQFYNN